MVLSHFKCIHVCGRLKRVLPDFFLKLVVNSVHKILFLIFKRFERRPAHIEIRRKDFTQNLCLGPISTKYHLP